MHTLSRALKVIEFETGERLAERLRTFADAETDTLRTRPLKR
jgi:hypothetical protein